MMELTLDKLPGGDAARRRTIARITLTNTGEQLGDVRLYEIRITEADEQTSAGTSQSTARTFREPDESALRLAYRALGKLLGEQA